MNSFEKQQDKERYFRRKCQSPAQRQHWCTLDYAFEWWAWFKRWHPNTVVCVNQFLTYNIDTFEGWLKYIKSQKNMRII